MTDGPSTFCLFVVGDTSLSRVASANAERILAERLGRDRYELTVIDLAAEPAAAEEFDLIATPVLVRTKPEPHTSFIGDLSAPYVADVILAGIDLPDED